ncbi:S-type pyocin domain-containing protein [Streptomyces sp. NPDC026672]|uniref:S-type pyocin domain-containing protein n=1 Tax=unclassified Streptomyces TaxID=2593676 RepID=UPI003409E23A
MEAEETCPADNVIKFCRAQENEEGAVRRDVSDIAHEPERLPAMVLNAERGIINTGTVHGGQHVTAIELSSHPHRGADGDI